MAKLLVTTTSLQDTPGPHQEALNSLPVTILRERGPLPESKMLELMGDIDYLICGDDHITRAVIQKAQPKLKCISKYGIGLDKIDLDACKELKMPVFFTPGVNHTTVAEHAMLLMLALHRNFVVAANSARDGKWKKETGHEVAGKTLGVIGVGRIGKELVKRANAFGMTCYGYDHYWDETFAKEHNLTRIVELPEILSKVDVISLHTNLTPETRDMINHDVVAKMKDGVIILNTARGELVETEAVAKALESGKIGGYGADVLDEEPPRPDHPLLKVLFSPVCLCPGWASMIALQAKNSIITPHIGSRTHESVARQAGMCIENLRLFMEGKPPKAAAVGPF